MKKRPHITFTHAMLASDSKLIHAKLKRFVDGANHLFKTLDPATIAKLTPLIEEANELAKLITPATYAEVAATPASPCTTPPTSPATTPDTTPPITPPAGQRSSFKRITWEYYEGCRNGDVPAIAKHVDKFGLGTIKGGLIEAIKHDQDAAIEFLCPYARLGLSDIYVRECKYGNMRAVAVMTKWCHSEVIKMGFNAACASGHLEVVRFIVGYNTPWIDGLVVAATNEREDVTRWLMSNVVAIEQTIDASSSTDVMATIVDILTKNGWPDLIDALKCVADYYAVAT